MVIDRDYKKSLLVLNTRGLDKSPTGTKEAVI